MAFVKPFGIASTRFSKFERFGKGVFTCQTCGKKTRQTPSNDGNDEICASCYEDEQDLNWHSDNAAEDKPCSLATCGRKPSRKNIYR